MALYKGIDRLVGLHLLPRTQYNGSYSRFRPVVGAQAVLSRSLTTRDSRQQQQNGNNRGSKQQHYWKATSAGCMLLCGGLAGGYWLYRQQKPHRRQTSLVPGAAAVGKVYAASVLVPGQIKESLPTYTKAQVAEHDSKDKGIWVTYKNGVYDITEYVQMHPGGKKILMAAGKSIEPFWNLYSVHKNDEVYEMMEALRIGNITEVEEIQKELDANDPYKNEPKRSPLLIPSSAKPFNAEPPVQILADSFLTPSHLFFVRNHLPVPCLQAKNFSLDVTLSKEKKVSLSVADLKNQFKKRSITAVTQCAGNRRGEMVKIKAVKGLNWGSAAISNAEWAGVTLNDLLKSQGVDIDEVKEEHIVFEGMDTQPDNSPYGASIPIELAQLLKNDILIAYEMNGQPIPRDHGYPLRVIIPGVVGARQVKWLKTIYFSNEESTSHWQRRDYKGFNSSIDWHNVDFDQAVSISQLPVISAICEPAEGTELEEGTEVTVKGYAWSGGGRGIIRVDVSADGGKTWQVATLKPNGQSLYKAWAWTLWEADVPLPEGATEAELVVKAVDVSYNVQPDSVEGIWNLRGVLSNAWHRVNVTVAK